MSDSKPTAFERCELDWQAFQYVAGELSPDDCEAFERRLEHDQSAREAVAGAVEVAQCTVAAERELTARTPAAAQTSSAWVRQLSVILSTATCLALFVAIHGMPRPERLFRSHQQGELAPARLSELAVIWSESREDWDESIWDSESEAGESFDPLSVLDAMEAGMDEAVDADDWIQQAVFTVGRRGEQSPSDGATDRGASL